MHGFALVGLLLVAAGCVEHPSLHAASVSEPSESSPPPSTPGTPSPTAGPPAPSSMNDTIPTSISREGRTWSVACVHILTIFRCQVLQEGSPLTETLAFPGTPVSLNATLAWTPVSPLHENLAVGLVDLDNPGPPPVFAEGPSPLRMDWDLQAFAGKNLGLHIIYYSNVDAGAANVAASLQQPWSLAGDVWSTT